MTKTAALRKPACPLNCGVYTITYIQSGKVYVGSSSNVRHRIKEHINALNKSKHRNQHLQNAWNKYGKDNFDSRHILLCAEKNKIKWEQYFIDCFKASNNMHGFNLSSRAGVTIPSLEMCKKISESQKKRLSNPEARDALVRAKLGKKFAPYKSGNCLKTHCPKGHPYSGDNLYIHPKSKRRDCRKCRKLHPLKQGGVL